VPCLYTQTTQLQGVLDEPIAASHLAAVLPLLANLCSGS